VEELDGGPTPFQSFVVHHWGQWRFRFFGQKIGAVQRSGLPLGSIIGGTTAHRHNVFLTGEIPVTREIDDIHQNFGIFFGEMGQGTVTKVSPHTTLGSPYNAIKISTLAPKNFEKFGKNFYGGRGPGPWGQTFRGWPQIQDGVR